MMDVIYTMVYVSGCTIQRVKFEEKNKVAYFQREFRQKWPFFKREIWQKWPPSFGLV